MRLGLILSSLFRCAFFLGCPMLGSVPNSLWISFSGDRSPNSCRFSESMGEDEFRGLVSHNLEPFSFA